MSNQASGPAAGQAGAGEEGVRRRVIVGVMGSGVEPHRSLSVPLGRLLAESGVHLLTGGGYGVMAEVARAFCGVPQRQGLSIGILRSGGGEPALDPRTGTRPFRPARMNPWVEIPIVTHLPLSGNRGQESMSRNHINVLTADILIALPGSAGTLSEVRLRVQYGRPVILFLGGGGIDGRDADRLRAESRFPERFLSADTLQEIPVRMRQSLEVAGAIPLPWA